MAKDKFAGVKSPREEDLNFLQRRLIRLVDNGTPMKNPGSWLETVWLGGFVHPRTKSSYPVDITLQYLEDVVNSLQRELPVGEDALRCRGYRKVKLRGRESETPGDRSQAGSEPMDIEPTGSDADADDMDEDTRLIFHPPRGKPLPPGERTKCINHLYEQAAAARRQNEHETRMIYEFPVTTEWYDLQRIEGRSFEHVHVAPWEEVFNFLKVHVQAVPGAGAPRTSNAGQITPRSPANDDTTKRG